MDLPKNQPPLEPDRLLPPNLERKTFVRPKQAPPSTAAVIRVLGGSILAALLLVFALVHFYGRHERLAKVENVLVKPSVLESVSFSDIDPLYKNKNIFFFDGIKFLYAGKQPDKAKSLIVNEYEVLFNALASDASIRIVTESLESQFQNSSKVSTLTIYVRGQDKNNTAESYGGAKKSEPMAFQTLQFLVESPYYRIAMRQSGTLQWVYFHHGQSLDPLLEKIQAL